MAFTTAVSAEKLYSFKDLSGDDNGPGKYTYPKNIVFVKKSFDLTEFIIGEDGDDYTLSFKIAVPFKNDSSWKNVNGWDIQMFDVYLNFGKGKYKHTIAGRNVKIKDGWDKAVIVSPEENKKMLEREIIPKNGDVFDDETDSENLVKDIIQPYSYQIDNNILTVRIKKIELEDLKKLKGVQVLVSGAEGFPSKQFSYIRNVNEQNSEWRFGGGTDYDGDSNVIDILGDNSKLKNYKSSEDEMIFPWINMIDVKTGK
jgi:carbohydrate-binding DOMON domain-containing protein